MGLITESGEEQALTSNNSGAPNEDQEEIQQLEETSSDLFNANLAVGILL